MSRSYVQELDAAQRQIATLERVRDGAAHDAILSSAMKIINRHDLVREFCDELLLSLGSEKEKPAGRNPREADGEPPAQTGIISDSADQ